MQIMNIFWCILYTYLLDFQTKIFFRSKLTYTFTELSNVKIDISIINLNNYGI